VLVSAGERAGGADGGGRAGRCCQRRDRRGRVGAPVRSGVWGWGIEGSPVRQGGV